MLSDYKVLKAKARLRHLSYNSPQATILFCIFTEAISKHKWQILYWIKMSDPAFESACNHPSPLPSIFISAWNSQSLNSLTFLWGDIYRSCNISSLWRYDFISFPKISIFGFHTPTLEEISSVTLNKQLSCEKCELMHHYKQYLINRINCKQHLIDRVCDTSNKIIHYNLETYKID